VRASFVEYYHNRKVGLYVHKTKKS